MKILVESIVGHVSWEKEVFYLTTQVHSGKQYQRTVISSMHLSCRTAYYPLAFQLFGASYQRKRKSHIYFFTSITTHHKKAESIVRDKFQGFAIRHQISVNCDSSSITAGKEKEDI